MRQMLLLLSILCHFSGVIFSQQQPKLMLPIGHTDEITSAHFSPDGKKVVTVSVDKTVKIWDAETGKLIADLKGHSSSINFAIFSPDGKKILTASSGKDYTAKIWDIETGVQTSTLTGHTDEILSGCFSPDGNKIATGSADNTIRIWDTKTKKTDTILRGHTQSVTSVGFSRDGKKILTTSLDTTAKIWDSKTYALTAVLTDHRTGIKFAHFNQDGDKILIVYKSNKDAVRTKIWNDTGDFVTDLKGDTSEVWSGYFSPDGKKIITASQDQTAKIWDVKTGMLDTAYEHEDAVVAAMYSQDGAKVVTASGNTIKIFDVKTKKLDTTLTGHIATIKSVEFSPDGRKIVTASADKTAKIWDVKTSNIIADLKSHTSSVKFACFSPDGDKIITVSSDSIARIWDAFSGKLVASLSGVNYKFVRFSPDSTKIIISSYDNSAKVWNIQTGKLDLTLTGHSATINAAVFSPDGKKIATASNDKLVKIWDTETGLTDTTFRWHKSGVNDVEYSHDGEKIVTVSDDNIAKIWNVKTSEVPKNLDGDNSKIKSALFSPDGKKILSAFTDNSIGLWNAATRKLDTVLKITKTPNRIKSAQFSSDGKKIIVVNVSLISVFDVQNSKLIAEFKDEAFFNSARFSPDGNKIVTASEDDTVKIQDIETKKSVAIFRHDAGVNTAEYSPDGAKIITASDDNTCNVWDVKKGKLLYTFFAIDSTDYLIMDSENGRYDGTQAARKLLYYTCGDEVIELEQVKGDLWEPGLTASINNGETFKTQTLRELNICGLMPKVEELIDTAVAYHFKITPRRGGLGKTVLLINNIETKAYDTAQLIRFPKQLNKSIEYYELKIKKTELEKFFIAGEVNPVTIKAYIRNNAISSRGFTIEEDKTYQPKVIPNLYGVIIGVNDYDDMNLKHLDFAAKDAIDISTTLAAAGRKLLNIDAKEHVFIYNLTTNSNGLQYPRKKGIKQTLDSINTKAKANDILFIFFAGHGVVDTTNKEKKFYFLPADASLPGKNKISNGISMSELTEWISPEKNYAQKRILIFDACNSGQAIENNTTKMGTRSVEINQQTKAVEKLNNQSGFFILAASSSKQSALELTQYSQGLLTYSLLKVIKEQPNILEGGGYLDVSNWFNAAKKTVSILAAHLNEKQEPQLTANNNFYIGLVDDSVRSRIKISAAKPYFSDSKFRKENTEVDGIHLADSIDKELDNSPEITRNTYKGMDVFSLRGNYIIKEDSITVNVTLVKGEETVNTFRKEGSLKKISDLIKDIIVDAMDWGKKNNWEREKK